MRRAPENQRHHCSACYGSGTRVEVHRSRYELERVLRRYGADEVLFVEADANAAIQFAMHGRYVQLALPLPDPGDARFTHTPSGKPRTATAQDRAYEQALREHWRSLLVAVRGKLQSVESGISTFEQEFDRFLIPHFAEEKTRRTRKKPKAVNWLLGGSHSLAIALVAAFLVPASAVGAFALPTNVVGQLAAPFRSAAAGGSASGDQADNGLALARGGWSPSHGTAASTDAGHLVALRSRFSTDGELRQPAALTSPPVEPIDVPAASPTLAMSRVTPLSTGDGPAAPPSPPAGGGGGGQQPASDGPRSSPTPPPDDTPVVPPADNGDVPESDDPATGDPTVQAPTDPSTTDSSAPVDGSSGDGTNASALPDSGDQTSPANGNGNGNGQGNGNANGQANGQGNGNANGQGNGNANGQANGNAQGNGKAVGNGKGGK